MTADTPARPGGGRRAISLFSGAMGLDIGLSLAGLDVALGTDADADCAATMAANGRRVLHADIRSLSPDTLLEAARMRRGEPFLVCGGPPCQPFSTAGRRRGVADPRGALISEFFRHIDGMRPRFFVMENVKGLLSSRVRPGLLDIAAGDDQNGDSAEEGASGRGLGGVLDLILSEVRKLGYRTVHGILDAVNYGVPQFRERLIMIGSRDGEDVFLPLPTAFQTHQDPRLRWRTLRDAVADLEDDPGECAAFGPTRTALLRLVPEGGNWRDLPEDLLKSAMGGAWASGGGKVGFYRRLAWDQPCPTLVTSPIQKATMMCHPRRDRPLSIREYARIQQFPDGWKFGGGAASRYRQIGNAVPVGLALELGRALLATADGTASVRTRRFRSTGVHERIRKALEMEGTDGADRRIPRHGGHPARGDVRAGGQAQAPSAEAMR